MKHTNNRMGFGAFIAPFHGLRDNVTLTFERDMKLVELMEELDFDEAWIGEHHSAGFEPIGSPELFIAAVAERTKRIRLGTGVCSLSYHHPLMLADRMVQLDHQSRGRVMFGVGPGQLPSDAFMLGVHPSQQRDIMAQSLDAILKLLDGESVSIKTDWFTLDDARLQLLSYQEPRMEMAVACAVTPNGPATAGRLGLSMLSVAASSGAGFAALPDHWRICAAQAAEHGRTVSRDSWRVVSPIHVAETREQARAEVAAHAMQNIVDYVASVGGTSLGNLLDGVSNGDDAVELWSTKGLGTLGVLTYGTPDDIADRIDVLVEQSGGFGTFLGLAHNAASWEATQRSYELFARFVMPRFRRSDRRRQSAQWATENSDRFIGALVKSVDETMARQKNLLSKG